MDRVERLSRVLEYYPDVELSAWGEFRPPRRRTGSIVQSHPTASTCPPPGFPHPRSRSPVGNDDSPELTCTSPHVRSFGVDGGSVDTRQAKLHAGYPHLPGTQGRWEQHPAVTSAKVTLPLVCKHG